MSVTVYELYDREGNALYVGATESTLIRFAAHRSRKGWWPDVDHERTVTTTYPNAKEAMRSERQRIESLRPLHNLAGVSSAHIPYTPNRAPDVRPDELAPEGEQLAQAREALQEATRAARTAAITAMGAGMSESEAARQYGVTRMTIRAWKAGVGNE